MSQRKVYSLDEINHWLEQTKRLSTFIQEEQDRLPGAQKSLVETQSIEANIQEKHLSPLAAEIRGLQARVDITELPGRISEVERNIATQEDNISRARQAHLEIVTNLTQIQDDIGRLQNQIAYQEARSLVESLPEQIDAENRIITRMRLSRDELRGKCSALDRAISSNESSLSSLRLSQSVDYTFNHGSFGHYGHHSSHGGHHGHHSHHGGFLHAVSDVSRDLEISRLSDRIRLDREEQRCVDNDIRRLDNDISRAETNLRNFNTQLSQARTTLVRQGPYISSSQGGNIYTLKAQLSDLQGRANAAERRRVESDRGLVEQADRLRRLGAECAGLRQSLIEAEALSKSNMHLEVTVARQLLAGKQAEHEQYARQRTLQHESTLQCQAKIAELQASIQKMQLTLGDLHNNTFMQRYHFKPNELTLELRQALTDAIAAYEFNHPARQHQAVRMLIHDLPYQADFICRNSAAGQVSYCQLTGLIHQAKEVLIGVGPDFSSALEEVLENHLLSKQDAIAAYQAIKPSMPLDITPEQLAIQEKSEFERLLDDFELQLNAETKHNSNAEHDFYNKGHVLVSSIKNARASDERYSKESFDYKLYTNVIKTAAQLLQAPADVKLQTNMANYAKHNTHGKSSTGRKVAGAIGMFLGAAIVVAAVIFGVLSLGMTSALSIAGFAAGGGLFLLSLGLCLSGRQRGVDKAMAGYHQAALFQKPATMLPYSNPSYFVPPPSATAPPFGK